MSTSAAAKVKNLEVYYFNEAWSNSKEKLTFREIKLRVINKAFVFQQELDQRSSSLN